MFSSFNHAYLHFRFSPLVGRTHIIVRLQTRNRRKDQGTENFGGLVCVLDGFPQRDFVLWVFMSPINISPFRPFRVFSVTIFYGYHAKGYHAPSIPHGLPRLYHHCTAITPVYISRLPRRRLPRPILNHGLSRLCRLYIPVTSRL